MKMLYSLQDGLMLAWATEGYFFRIFIRKFTYKLNELLLYNMIYIYIIVSTLHKKVQPGMVRVPTPGRIRTPVIPGYFDGGKHREEAGEVRGRGFPWTVIHPGQF